MVGGIVEIMDSLRFYDSLEVMYFICTDMSTGALYVLKYHHCIAIFSWSFDSLCQELYYIVNSLNCIT